MIRFREHKVRRNPCIGGIKILFDPIIIYMNKIQRGETDEKSMGRDFIR